jgi:hypothetical protein
MRSRAGFLCLAQALAHVRFAQYLALRFLWIIALLTPVCPQGCHGFGHRGKKLFAVAAFLHHVIPPAFAIGIAGGVRQPVQRVACAVVIAGCLVRQCAGFFTGIIPVVWCSGGFCARRFWTRFIRLPTCLLQCQAIGHRQIDQAYRHGMQYRPLDRLPLRRKLGEGVIHRQWWLIGTITQQGHRWLHALGHHGLQQAFAFRRTLNQNAIG